MVVIYMEDNVLPMGTKLLEYMFILILFYDNLKPHLDDDSKRVFEERKLFLCQIPPPNTTCCMQKIDAGIGRELLKFHLVCDTTIKMAKYVLPCGGKYVQNFKIFL